MFFFLSDPFYVPKLVYDYYGMFPSRIFYYNPDIQLCEI